MKLKNKKAEKTESSIGDIVLWIVFIIIGCAATIYIMKFLGGLR